MTDMDLTLPSFFRLPTAAGIVISGPSGSGKTLLATCLAYEARSQFKMLAVSCADLVHKVASVLLIASANHAY